MKFEFYQKNLKKYLTGIKKKRRDSLLVMEVKNNKVFFIAINSRMSYDILQSENLKDICIGVNFDDLFRVIKDNKNITVSFKEDNLAFAINGFTYPIKYYELVDEFFFEEDLSESIAFSYNLENFIQLLSYRKMFDKNMKTSDKLFLSSNGWMVTDGSVMFELKENKELERDYVLTNTVYSFLTLLKSLKTQELKMYLKKEVIVFKVGNFKWGEAILDDKGLHIEKYMPEKEIKIKGVIKDNKKLIKDLKSLKRIAELKTEGNAKSFLLSFEKTGLYIDKFNINSVSYPDFKIRISMEYLIKTLEASKKDVSLKFYDDLAPIYYENNNIHGLIMPMTI